MCPECEGVGEKLREKDRYVALRSGCTNVLEYPPQVQKVQGKQDCEGEDPSRDIHRAWYGR